MKSLSQILYDVTVLILIAALSLFTLTKNVCLAKHAKGLVSEGHVKQMQCELYDETKCSELKRTKPNESCFQTEECSTDEGRTHGCFVLWKIDNGSVTIKMKGCFMADECNNSQCIDVTDDKELHYCCCMGNMCNMNFTWEPKPKSLVPVVKVEPEIEDDSTSAYIWGICIFVVLTTLMVAFYICFYRKKNMFNEVPTMEPLSVQQPSPLLGLKPIQLIEIKARGRFGAVWKAKLAGEEIAVKIFPVQDKQSWIQEQEIFKLPNMNHPNILHYIGVEKRGDNLQAEFWLITAYHDRGSLCDFLKAHTLTWSELCKIVETMARGLMHLHEEIPGRHNEPLKPSIAHRDFKSKNVLLKNDMTACIADFGLALVFESGKPCGDTHGQVGTRRYMAPEVLEGAINFTPDAFLRIDMYACGLVLWELVSRSIAQDSPVPEYRLPFEDEVGQHPTLEDMQENVVQRKVRPAIPESWRNHPGLAALCETMEECWDHDAEARLSASCVMERVLNQSKYHHSSLSMYIENEVPRSPTKENSM